jgi:predicted metal-dependent hydrolase
MSVCRSAARPGRYLPDRALPAYAYVPGRHPHPVRDPAGHSHGAPEPEAAAPAAEAWADCADYLYGIDLFNCGYYWEAHEAWEGLWRAAEDPRVAGLLHGLIKLSAVGVKARAGNPRGVARHAAAAADLFRPLAAEGRTNVMGLDPRALKEAAEEIAAACADGDPPGEASPVLALRPE